MDELVLELGAHGLVVQETVRLGAMTLGQASKRGAEPCPCDLRSCYSPFVDPVRYVDRTAAIHSRFFELPTSQFSKPENERSPALAGDLLNVVSELP